MSACLLKSSFSAGKIALGSVDGFGSQVTQQENVCDPQGNATHLMDDDGSVLADLACDAGGSAFPASTRHHALTRGNGVTAKTGTGCLHPESFNR